MHKCVWNKLNDRTLSTMRIITGQTYAVIFSTLFLQMNATHHYLINGIYNATADIGTKIDAYESRDDAFTWQARNAKQL